MAHSGDTIAAQATPPGRGGVGIIRVSGPAAAAVAEAILGHCPRPRHAAYLPFHDSEGAVLDMGIALFFPGPHSFTGEDVLELQGHGGPVVLDLLLKQVLAYGARLARPGEFSERAFLNDKLDLVQAEAIADLIDCASEQAARCALRSLQGEFSSRIHALVEGMVNLRMYVEAAIDFPEEEIDFLADGRILSELAALETQLAGIFAAAHQGSLLREGMTVVIAGQPNAGKSSLLNQLAGRETAIVTDIPGTTRDLLREQILLDGMPLHVIDTAGLRESDDAVEREGIRRAWDAIAGADRVLLLVDDRHGVTAEDAAILARLPQGPGLTVVRNKVDLSGAAAEESTVEGVATVRLSARTGDGVEHLRRHLERAMGYRQGGEGGFMARRRHLEALEQAGAALARGREALVRQRAGELLAEELRLAHEELSTITGAFGADDLLGRIFASFCIGK